MWKTQHCTVKINFNCILLLKKYAVRLFSIWNLIGISTNFTKFQRYFIFKQKAQLNCADMYPCPICIGQFFMPSIAITQYPKNLNCRYTDVLKKPFSLKKKGKTYYFIVFFHLNFGFSFRCSENHFLRSFNVIQ